MRTNLAWIVLAVSAMHAQNLPVPESGNVTLSIDDYNRLTDLASHPPKKPENAPVPYVLKSADLNLRAGADSVSGSVKLEGEIFATGDRKVPLVNGMIVEDASQQGKDLPLEHEGNSHSAVLTGPGDFNVTLNAALPLGIETGRASFTLPVPLAGFARVTLTVPGEQTQISLAPGIVTSRSSRNGQTVIEATLVPGQNATVWWASRLNFTPTPTAAPREVRLLSDMHTLISATEADLVIASLAQVTVVQGEPSEFRLSAPAGYELTGATGATLASSDVQGSTVILRVTEAAARSHEFLITLVKSNPKETKAEVPLVTFQGTQRETGEVLVESDGAMELTAAEKGGLRRMDLKELSPSLRAPSRGTMQAAFRYQKHPNEAPELALDWVRFSDSKTLSAVAQKAEVTTLVTVEGRSLTELKLTVRNQSQPFLKVGLPAGASILSAEVAGETVKPVQGTDGSRVPLLRAGFRPSGPYEVSFVILNPASPLARKGDSSLTLPKMDVPIGQVAWEVFLPRQLMVSNFGGDVRPAHFFTVDTENTIPTGPADVEFPLRTVGGIRQFTPPVLSAGPGILAGSVTDPSGAVVGGASVAASLNGRTYSAITGPDGRWAIAGVPSGTVSLRVQSPGFKVFARNFYHDENKGSSFNNVLEVGAASDSVMVTAEVKGAPQMTARDVQLQQEQAKDTLTSANVGELQRKVAGVLPIAINIPRTGSSYRFVRPLVLDEDTRLTFQYKRK